MEEIFRGFQEAFKNNMTSEVIENSKKFAWLVTSKLMDNDMESLYEICKLSSNMRDNIEFDNPIIRDRGYYYGYWFAYENIARKLYSNTSLNLNVDIIIDQNPKLNEIIDYLYQQGYAHQNELANILDISASYLSNILNKEEIKNIGLFNTNKVGRNMIYSLNSKGREYYETRLSDNQKLFNQRQLIDILDYILENIEDMNIYDLSQKLGIIQNETLNSIYDSIIYFRFRKEIETKQYLSVDDEEKYNIEFDNEYMINFMEIEDADQDDNQDNDQDEVPYLLTA